MKNYSYPVKHLRLRLEHGRVSGAFSLSLKGNDVFAKMNSKRNSYPCSAHCSSAAAGLKTRLCQKQQPHETELTLSKMPDLTPNSVLYAGFFRAASILACKIKFVGDFSRKPKKDETYFDVGGCSRERFGSRLEKNFIDGQEINEIRTGGFLSKTPDFASYMVLYAGFFVAASISRIQSFVTVPGP